MQHLVYALDLTVAGDVAMILPLPVRTGLGDNALTFTNLEGYPGIFEDFEKGFPRPQMSRGAPVLAPASILKVHEVGAFDASFVPHPEDFERIDPMFRLSPEVWRALPQYDDYGFAVFRFAEGRQKTIHPMAMTFETRFPDYVFFPTVHVHDGRVHEKADFDHSLYFQRRTGELAREEHATFDFASTFVRCDLAKGMVDPAARIVKRELRGKFQNSDFFVKL